MNLADRIVSWLDPVAGLRRSHARKVIAYYEAAKSDRLRKGRRETGNGNDAVLRAGSSLRQQARHLEQNYDLAVGVLNTLVANTIGANGIAVEPQPRRTDGSIDTDLSRQILDLHKDWARRPEVTWEHDWPATQRLLARSWFRDGEVFAQTLLGLNPVLDHGTRVPYSIELIECDMVPMDLNASRPAAIVQGIEINAWGRAVAYHVFKTDPREHTAFATGQTKRIAAANMLKLATLHRIRQLRGVSLFASVLTRFDDLKDYEESERIAAKIAASMAAFIRKGNPDMYDPDTGASQRNLKMRPGMIFDDLKPGEEIGTIDTNRPNPNLEAYRSGQLKAVAAGTGATYSSLSKSYDGTYSAQRQELVEGWGAYAILANEFTSRIVRPVYEQFIAAAVASGALKIPAGIRPDTIDDAIYIAPQMPWIDPAKEATAYATLEEHVYISGPEIIRKRGGNPIDVLEQAARWREEKAKRLGDDQPAGAADTTATSTAQAIADRIDDLNERMDHLHAQASAPHDAAPAIDEPPPLPSITIVNNLPAQAASHAPNVTIENHLPEQPAPTVTVENRLPEQAAPMVTIENHLPEQPAPTVTVHNAVAAAPISDIRIVALPDRETRTEIKRDNAGNIVESLQVETDADEDTR